MSHRSKSFIDASPLLWDHLYEPKPVVSSELEPIPSRQPQSMAHYYTQAYREIIGKTPKKIKGIQIIFYPYREVQANMYFKDGILKIKLAKVLQDMPEDLHQILALILVGKLEKKPYPTAEEKRFDEYARSDFIQNRLFEQNKLRPQRKRHYGTQGKRYNLHEVFDRVNQEYFQGKLARPVLSWTQTASRRRMGYVDGEKQRIYISRTLDRPSAPRYAIDFVMFHEILHLLIPSEKKGRRIFHHTKAFREAEKRFKKYQKARKWLGHK